MSKKAKHLVEDEVDIIDCGVANLIYTQLTPIDTDSTVFCPCTGVDHIRATNVIYLDDEWKRGEGRNITSTAEHTFSLILQLAKMRRMQLSGKTIGIIGYGRIGQRVAKYAQAFDMNVLAYDGQESTLLHNILHDTDIVTLHVPLNDETKGMIGHKELEIMKYATLLVNTSRPEIINKDDLKKAIANKNIYYADDFKDDLYLFDYHSNVIQTRHIGGNCIEAREATDIYIAKKAIEWWRCRQ
jgi:D-3-phosphoglycerate dehydrogenase